MSMVSLTTRAKSLVAQCSEHTPDAKMTTPMNVRLRKVGNVLDCSRHRSIVRLGQDMFDKALLRKVVHDPGNPIPTKTVWLSLGMSNREHEVGRNKWPILNTASTSSASQVKYILSRIGRHISSVSIRSTVNYYHSFRKGGFRHWEATRSLTKNNRTTVLKRSTSKNPCLFQ